MQNIGRWNSDLVIVYAFFFFLPMVMYFFMGLVLKFREFSTPKTVYVESKPKIVYKKHKQPKIVQFSCEKTNKPKKEKKSNPPDISTNTDLIEDAISALARLGYKKTVVKQRITNICKNNVFTKVEDIILKFMEA